MRHWTWACASQVGTSHLRTGLRLQDAYSCFTCQAGTSPVFIGIVSDGAGSAEFGGEGAALVCRSIGSSLRAHFKQSQQLPTAADFEYWVDEARDSIYIAASNRGKAARDFACTLVCVVSDGGSSIVAHIGDGCVVTRNADSQIWFAPTWPDHGEYASTTTFVTDQPSAKLRVSLVTVPVDVVCAFSDGIERLVLDLTAKEPATKFFAAMAPPVIKSVVIGGKDRSLSDALKEYLAGEAVNARTDDDKTLLIAALK
jgi:hypothetical protein